MQTKSSIILAVMLFLAYSALNPHTCTAAREAKGERDAGSYASYKFLERGKELIDQGETERGIKMLEAVIEQDPRNKIRFEAYLELGKHYLGAHENAKAVENLRNLALLEDRRGEVAPEDLDLYLEGLFLTGVAQFNARQYSPAFSTLRKITNNYPNTPWANQAYYYIGMSHFAQQHWSKAIKNLTMVGTLIDPDSPEVELVEAGNRFFVKLNDKDLPVLYRLGKDIPVLVSTTSGDRETILCGPQMESDIFIGSVPTETGKGRPGDGVLNIIGGDKIHVKYIDDSTKAGEKNVPREKNVEVVSTATMEFTRGTFKYEADTAYLEQPVFIRLKDIDKDLGPQADTVTVTLRSTYKKKEEDTPESTIAVDIDKLLKEEEEKTIVRDEITVTLTETGDKPVRTGKFTGQMMVSRATEGKETENKKDDTFSCEVGDTIIASYVDDRSIMGDTPLEVSAKIVVFDEIDSKPRADQDVVDDVLTRAKKELVEAEAYLEIARIFQGMGLMKGAKEKADEGLDRVKFAIQTRAALPASLREKAFQIKWNLYLAQDDFQSAMATCSTFSKLYPESQLVDKALMGMAKAFIEKKEFDEAINVLTKIERMPNSRAKAEAAYLIADVQDKRLGSGSSEKAVRAFINCARRYPDSEFAGPALAKVVDYHIKTEDYLEAEDTLEQIFMDYQDEDFLDSMLLKWVLVSYEMGNYRRAEEKCRKLLFDYPDSTHIKKAQEIMPKIEAELSKTESQSNG